MVIKLCRWEEHYPDGITLTTFRRIQRLLGTHGTVAPIDVKVWTEDGLKAALDQLERSGKVGCFQR